MPSTGLCIGSRFSRLVFGLVLATTVGCPVSYYGPEAVAAMSKLSLPPRAGVVNDYANVLSSPTEDSVTAMSERLRAKTGVEIIVVSVQSLNGESRENVQVQIEHEWKLGKRPESRDPANKTGAALLLLAVDDKQIGLSFSRTAEWIVDDRTAGAVLEEMAVHFKNAGFDGATINGTRRLVDLFARHFKVTL